MKTILMISPFFSPNVGGVETHLDDLVAFLAGKYRLLVATYKPLTSPNIATPIKEQRKNLLIYRLPWLRGKYFYLFEKNPLVQFLYLFPGIFIVSCFLLIKQFGRIKIIHGHGLAALLVTVVLGKIFAKKSVVSLHTIYKFKDNRKLARIVRPFLLAVDKILILAKAGKDDLVAIGIPAEKIAFYTNWVDVKKVFTPTDKNKTRQKLGLPQEKTIFLFVGRFSPEKGVGEVLKIISLLKRKDAFFVLVGDGPLKPQADIVREKHPDLVRLEGLVKPVDLPAYYQAADFLIWASVDQDYFGRVPMGALACGLPVLVPTKTAYFGKWEKVTVEFPEGKIGYWIDPDPVKAAVKIDELQKKDLSKTSRQYALTHFSSQNGEIFLTAYGD